MLIPETKIFAYAISNTENLFKLGTVVPTYNLSTREAKAGGWEV
jgi:hypothetical protein